MFSRIFTAHIRPTLEYCIYYQFDHPIYGKCDLLEKVQWRVTKNVPEIVMMSYRERLAPINLPMVEESWNRGETIATLKVKLIQQGG